MLERISNREIDYNLARRVALGYLCDLPLGYQPFSKLDGQVTRNLALMDGTIGSDPLVRFYKTTNAKNRIKNAVHFYLASSGVNVPNADLIEENHQNRLMFENFTNSFFAPTFKSMRERFYKILDVNAGYFDLLVHSFNRTDLDGKMEKVPTYMLMPIFLEELHREYSSCDKFDMERVVDETRVELSRKVAKGLTTLTPLKREVIEEQLDKLTPREKEVIRKRFRLDGQDIQGKMPFEMINKELQLHGAEGIRQTLFRSLRNFNTPQNQVYTLPLLLYPTDEELLEHYKAIPKA